MTTDAFGFDDLFAEIRFFVPGKAATAGSKVPFIHKQTGRAMVKDDCKASGAWKQDCKVFAHQSYSGAPIAERAIYIEVVFIMARPKHHYGSCKGVPYLKPDAPNYHISKPDGSKLFRALEDALTGVIWKDDAQVQHKVTKRYGDKPGAHVLIKPL